MSPTRVFLCFFLFFSFLFPLSSFHFPLSTFHFPLSTFLFPLSMSIVPDIIRFCILPFVFIFAHARKLSLFAPSAIPLSSPFHFPSIALPYYRND